MIAMPRFPATAFDPRSGRGRARTWVLPWLLLLLLAPAAPRGAEETAATLRGWAVLTDPTGAATIDTIAATDPATFTPLPASGAFSAGFSRAVFWLRFELAAPPGSEWLLDILPPYLDDLRLYMPAPEAPGHFIERRSGDHLPFASRELPYRGFAFRLRQGETSSRVGYLRLRTTSAVHMVPRLWSPGEFFATAQRESGLIYASMAVLLTLLVLNANNGFWLADPLLPWLCAYIASLILMFSGVLGLVTPYLPQDRPVANDLWIGLSNLAVMAFSSAFHLRLFAVGRNQALTYGLYQAGFWLPWLGIPGVVHGRYPELMSTLFSFYLLLTLAGLSLAGQFWYRRVAGARLTFLAAAAGLGGTLLIILNVKGMVQGGLPLLHCMLLASLIQVMALHLAVGARYRRLQLEKRQEQDRTILALAEARREREARAEQSGLFAMISHEIRNPLAMIGGAVQTLRALVEETPEVERRHDRIRRAVLRIDALIEKTLEYDQVMAGLQGGENWRTFDPGRLVADILGDYDLPPARLALTHRDPCVIRGHRGLLEILVTNLLDNALKYSPGDTAVRVDVRRTGQTCRLEVRDQGPGIPDTLRPTLFNRYVRGKDVGDVAGAGLGLFLVARIAEWHGGRVECLDRQTCPGGACFRVDIPCGGP